MANAPYKEEDEFGFEEQVPTGPDPNNTGLALDGTPNPPYITSPPDPVTGFTTDNFGFDQQGTDGSGSIADPQASGGAGAFTGEPQLQGTDGAGSTDGAFGEGPDLYGTGTPGTADFGFDADLGSGGANQPTAAYAPAGIADVAMPDFGDPAAGAGPRDRMNINNEISQYALDFMRAPTRYDMDVVQSAVDAIRQQDGEGPPGRSERHQGVPGRSWHPTYQRRWRAIR